MAKAEKTPKAKKPLFDYNKVLESTEKKFGIEAETLNSDKRDQSISSGMLCTDLLLGNAGWVPGWNTSLGFEQSAKTTTAICTLHQAYIADVPVIQVWDYEKSFSAEYCRNFFGNMMPENVFGLRSAKGTWEIPPRIRPYDEHTAEPFFDMLHSTMKALPRKRLINKSWFLVFEDNKANRAMLDGKWSPVLQKQLGKLCVEVEDGTPQGFIMLDSYPAMLPEGMDDDESGNAMAKQARMFSEQSKRIQGLLGSRGFVLLGINQMRLRPAVMMGNPEYEPCFPPDTTVLLKGGEIDTIGNIVRKKRKVKVASFDKETGKISYKRIIAWKNNGRKSPDDLMIIKYNAFDNHGNPIERKLEVTKNHKFWSNGKWVTAENLQVGNKLHLSMGVDHLSNDSMQVFYGGLLGDGVFSTPKDSIRWEVLYSHVRYQVPYMMWKASMLDEHDPYEMFKDSSVQHYHKRGKISNYRSEAHYNPEMAEMCNLKSNHKELNENDEEIIRNILNNLDLKGLAVWYADDGYFSNDTKNGMVTHITCDRFSEGLKTYAIAKIAALVGLTPNDLFINKSNGKICINIVEKMQILHDAIAPYTHKSMAYKLSTPEHLVGTYDWKKKSKQKSVMVGTVVTYVGPTTRRAKTEVFDLTIEDNHTYFVGGSFKQNGRKMMRSTVADFVAVSNCGEALKLASSVRLLHKSCAVPAPFANTGEKGAKQHLIEKSSISDDGGVDSYRYITIDVEKNKMGGAPKGSRVYQRIWAEDATGTARGLDPVFDTWQYLNLTGQSEGNMKKFTIDMKGNPLHKKTLDIHQLKVLIAGNPEQRKKVAKKLNLDKNPKLREACFAQLKDNTGYEKFKAQ